MRALYVLFALVLMHISAQLLVRLTDSLYRRLKLRRLRKAVKAVRQKWGVE